MQTATISRVLFQFRPRIQNSFRVGLEYEPGPGDSIGSRTETRSEFVTISVQVRGYNIVAEEKLTESCQRENPSSFSRGRDIAEKCFAMMNTTDGILRCTFLKWFSLNTSFFCIHHSSLFAINFYIKNLYHKYFNIRYISCKHFWKIYNI